MTTRLALRVGLDDRIEASRQLRLGLPIAALRLAAAPVSAVFVAGSSPPKRKSSFTAPAAGLLGFAEVESGSGGGGTPLLEAPAKRIEVAVDDGLDLAGFLPKALGLLACLVLTMGVDELLPDLLELGSTRASAAASS